MCLAGQLGASWCKMAPAGMTQLHVRLVLQELAQFCSHKEAEVEDEEESKRIFTSLHFNPVCSPRIGHSRSHVPESEWVETAKPHRKGQRYREIINGDHR